MAHEELLSQEEIDALLNGPSNDAGAADAAGAERIHAYDPATQHRVIRERLHGLELVNQRFARRFRVGLFNLIRRSADITVEGIQYQSYKDFVRNMPVPTNLNLVSMQPLRGTALVVFPPNLIYLVVDNLFGGDGRLVMKSEGREFTNTEQRIIRRILDLALDAYQHGWQSLHPMQMAYVRSEVQAKFANITNSPNEIVVATTFHVDVGNLSSNFQICIPYTMLEPLRELLTNAAAGSAGAAGSHDRSWAQRVASTIRSTEVELVTGFVDVPSRIRRVRDLKPGDVLPIELPQSVTARVDGVPVLECAFGTHNHRRALRVLRVINHFGRDGTVSSPASAATESAVQGSDHE